MSYAENVRRIMTVYDALEEIAEDVVFVGGATVALYADRPAMESRPTEDVDILVEVAGRTAYAEIEEILRSKGFVNDVESGVICRYVVNNVVVDVMPTDEGILGFSNRWYEQAFATAFHYRLDDDHEILIMLPEYFLATKLEAFKGRGNGDGRFSSDFEDIVFLLNNRKAIWEEMVKARVEIREYLRENFSIMLGNKYFQEWLEANLEFYEQSRATWIIGSLREFTDQ